LVLLCCPLFEPREFHRPYKMLAKFNFFFGIFTKCCEISDIFWNEKNFLQLLIPISTLRHCVSQTLNDKIKKKPRKSQFYQIKEVRSKKAYPVRLKRDNFDCCLVFVLAFVCVYVRFQSCGFKFYY
jgi:hypothetical protein